MIITKADIGRKAVARDGSVFIVKKIEEDVLFPIMAHSKEHGFEYFMPSGRFWMTMESPKDLIRWADETEAIK